jgi:hypothetical protein
MHGFFCSKVTVNRNVYCRISVVNLTINAAIQKEDLSSIAGKRVHHHNVWIERKRLL